MKSDNNKYIVTLDDDPTVGRFISKATGLTSLPFTSSKTLLKRAHSYQPLVAFIDVHLDETDCGLDIIRELRTIWSWTPLIVITSDISESVIGEALALGANDFLRKPLNPTELLARMRSRIAEMALRKNSSLVSVNDFQFCKVKSSIEKNGKVCFLPSLETQLLSFLVENLGLITSREEIKRRIWGRVIVSENALDKKVSTIRNALLEIDSMVTIKSIYGQGLILEQRKCEKMSA